MKKIIAVTGHAQCGKTECLQFLCEMLSEEGELLASIPVGDKDKREAFLYNGQVICVGTGGDFQNIVKENFDFAIRMNADLIVTASRTKRGPINEVRRQGKALDGKDGKLVIIRKSVEYHLEKEIQTLCNRKYAEYIFSEFIKKV